MTHLKYLFVTPSSDRSSRTGAQRGVLFLVHPEEELQILTAIHDSHRKMEVVFSRPLDSEAAHHELTALMTAGRTLGVTSQPVPSPEITKLVLHAHIRGTRIIDFEAALVELIPSISSSMDDIIKVVVKSGMQQGGNIRMYSKFKNIAEPLVAAALLLILAPVLAIVALMVKLTSQGPAFYGQTRLGLGGREFKILKFRSMRTDAEKDGPVWASAKTKDVRLSPIGGFLRATHLDELPQFWNIVRGEVSFIGPRPERKLFSDQLQKVIPAFALRTLVKPGITGWAQTRQGYANSIEDSRKKLELDFYYILKHSPRLDAQVVFNTLGLLISGGTEGKKRRVMAPLKTKVSRPAAYGQAIRLPMFWRRFHLTGPAHRSPSRQLLGETRVEGNTVVRELIG